MVIEENEKDVTLDHISGRIGVVGAGNMGVQIACHLSKMGFDVLLKTRSTDSIDSIIQRIKFIQTRHLGFDGISKEISICVDYKDLQSCVFVIETVIEDLSIKKDVLQHIELAVSTDCIIATNTSGLSINELASSFIKPGRFVGFHFFNPISRMHLIEIIRSKYTRDAIVSSTKEFSKAIGKEPVVCDDRPGFIVNRILMPQLNYAISMVNEGLEPHIIDTAIRLGLNHPMGPLELADMIGLDVCLKTMSSIYQQTGDPRFDPCQLLTKLVDEGKLGRKTKHGFYDYGEKE